MIAKIRSGPRFVAGLIAVCLVLTLFSGCGLVRKVIGAQKMPFNGTVSFHEITVEIPAKFVRDSTQSNDTYWYFEHGWYSEVIILMCKESSGDIESYIQYLEENGFETEQGTFIDCPAIKSVGVNSQGKTHREMFFIYNGHNYAVALTGGTEEEFEDLYNSIEIPGLVSTDPTIAV